jgi:hypothetical protein
MRKREITLAGALALVLLLAAATSAAAETTTCRMNFELKGWAAGLQAAHGDGVVTCDNGQTAEVVIHAKGAGLSAGKYKIREGHGKFTNVSDISEIFGSYGGANVGAGLGKDAGALALTKGEVSLALEGKGTGVELGAGLERFTLSPRGKGHERDRDRDRDRSHP